jgi:decaprenylphospho-beta-D-erythro-pentofuranosid-2-ulose 2-reductase
MTFEKIETPSLLVLGGCSDIGLAIAERFAKEGWLVMLAGRRRQALDAAAKAIQEKTGARVVSCFCDVEDLSSHRRFLAGQEKLPDVVVSSVGFMQAQDALDKDPVVAARVLSANFNGPALLLHAIGKEMALAGKGVIVGISSVAGERGRGSNYLYGSAKAGFTAFLSGLRNKLHPSGVRVMTVLPGFVDTKMVADLDLPEKLTASPGQVAEAVWQGVEKGRDVVFVLPVWRLIMMIIRWIPESVFKKLSL